MQIERPGAMDDQAYLDVQLNELRRQLLETSSCLDASESVHSLINFCLKSAEPLGRPIDERHKPPDSWLVSNESGRENSRSRGGFAAKVLARFKKKKARRRGAVVDINNEYDGDVDDSSSEEVRGTDHPPRELFFFQLSADLMGHIADFLDESSCAALFLCCKRISNMLRKASLTSCRLRVRNFLRAAKPMLWEKQKKLGKAARLQLEERTKMQQKHSEEIDEQISEHKRRLKSEVLVLVVGCRGAGKSTFIRQALLRWKGAPTPAQLQLYAPVVVGALVDCIRVLVEAAETLELSLSQDTKERAQRILLSLDTHYDQQKQQRQHLSGAALSRDAAALWADVQIQRVFANRGERNAGMSIGAAARLDSAPYLFFHVARILTDDCQPTLEDYMRCGDERHHFSGGSATAVTEQRVSHGIAQPYRFIRVDNMNSASRKWMHYFERASAVLHVADMNSCDERSPNGSHSVLHDSIEMFSVFFNSRWFRLVPFILILNKSDLFLEKLTAGGESPLQRFFPEYDKSEEDYDGDVKKDLEHAKEFLAGRFHQTYYSAARFRHYCHCGCSTESKNIAEVVHMLVCQHYRQPVSFG